MYLELLDGTLKGKISVNSRSLSILILLNKIQIKQIKILELKIILHNLSMWYLCNGIEVNRLKFCLAIEILVKLYKISSGTSARERRNSSFLSRI